MMVLEEASDLLPLNPASTPSRPAAPVTDASTPDLVTESGSGAPPGSVPGITFAQRVLVYQLGVLSLILWLPSMYLPILRLSYSGAALDFLKDSRLQVFLWDIPLILGRHGSDSGSAPWIMGLLGFLHLSTLIILPLLASCLCVLVWLGDPFWSKPSKRVLFAIQPGMAGTVFVVALWGTLHALYPTLAFHEHACRLIQLPTEPCLSLHGRTLPGA